MISCDCGLDCCEYCTGYKAGVAAEKTRLENIISELRSYVSMAWVPDKFDDPSGQTREVFSKRWDAIVAGTEDELDE